MQILVRLCSERKQVVFGIYFCRLVQRINNFLFLLRFPHPNLHWLIDFRHFYNSISSLNASDFLASLARCSSSASRSFNVSASVDSPLQLSCPKLVSSTSSSSNVSVTSSSTIQFASLKFINYPSQLQASKMSFRFIRYSYALLFLYRWCWISSLLSSLSRNLVRPSRKISSRDVCNFAVADGLGHGCWVSSTDVLARSIWSWRNRWRSRKE